MALPNILTATIEQIIGFGVGGAVTPVIEWAARPIVYEVNSADPNMILTPDLLAQMVVQGVIEQPAAAGEAAKNGIDAERFDHMVKVSGSPPGPQDLLSMWDRGIINEADVRRGLLQSRIKPEWVDAVVKTNPALLTIEELANMVVQGIMSQDEGAKFAAYLSYSAAQFTQLTRLAGNPPGPETMLDLWNRGIVTEQQVDVALVQSRLKPEWVDTLKKSRIRPASLASAVNAVVRERIPVAQGVKIAAENGIDEATFLLMVDESARPMGTGQALTLVRRGEMTTAAFREVIARSNVRTEYTDDILKLKRVIPPLFQISRLVASGSLTDALAIQYVIEEGYDTELAHSIVEGAHKAKSGTTHKLSQSLITELYESGLETRDWAKAALVAWGLQDADAELSLDLIDARRLITAIHSDLTVIHAEFVNHKIDDNAAQAAIDSLGISQPTRDHLMSLWENEIKNRVLRLTNAQIGQALKYNVITLADAEARWIANGYPAADAAILAGIVEKGPVSNAPVAP